MNKPAIIRQFGHVTHGIETLFTIRPISSDDILELREAAVKEKIRFTPKTELYGLYNEDWALIGFSGIDWQGSRAVFKHAYVIPEYRKQGLWMKMFEYRQLVASLRPGIKTIEATCTPMSINLYLRLGAQVVTQYKELTKVRIPL